MKTDLLYVTYVLEKIQAIEEYLTLLNPEQEFYKRGLIHDACLRNLHLLTETVSRISPETKDKFPHVPWQKITNFRNVVVHDYFNLDLVIIWKIINEELPLLKQSLLEIQPTLPDIS
jgi:uncharacterized protein with HEPN domain